MLGMGCIILLWHSLDLPYNHSVWVNILICADAVLIPMKKKIHTSTHIQTILEPAFCI